MDSDQAARAFRELVEVIRALRTPGTGCPWDLEQDHRSLRPYLIEEAHEVLEAIDRGDDAALREELGDLLLQVLLHSQVASDRGAFSVTEVARGIREKMVRRHPHVFGSAAVSGAAEVHERWQQIKAAEARQKGEERSHAGGLARLPQGLPALLRAQRVGEKAARVGLDAAPLGDLFRSVRAGLDRLERVSAPAGEGAPGPDREGVEHQLGEILFALAQLARRAGVSAEDSLRARTGRFVDRFARMEERLGGSPTEMSREEVLRAWEEAGEIAPGGHQE